MKSNVQLYRPEISSKNRESSWERTIMVMEGFGREKVTKGQVSNALKPEIMKNAQDTSPNVQAVGRDLAVTCNHWKDMIQEESRIRVRSIWSQHARKSLSIPGVSES